ncbi:hypothetical protein [Clostridium beijerinckii]|nr:hypothetical protein [Clostridium beijerinckii]
MSKGKYPYVPTPEDVPAPDLSDIYSPEAKNSSNKNYNKNTDSNNKDS